MEALHFILDSWWNTAATILAIALFRPVRISIRRRSDDDQD